MGLPKKQSRPPGTYAKLVALRPQAEDVSRVLWSLGARHACGEATADGLFCVDIALEGEKARAHKFSCANPLS